MYADGMFTVSYSLHGSQQPGEIIRCIDKNDYSTLSFPVGTRVTLSIDDTTTKEGSRELRVSSLILEHEIISLAAKTQHHYLAMRKTHCQVFAMRKSQEAMMKK